MTETDFPVEADPTAELTANFSQTARALFSAGSVGDTLQQVVDLAVVTIEGCDYAGIFLLEAEAVTTPVHTDPIVAEIDAAQQRAGEGPCLDAITHANTFYAGDLVDETRWPRFAPCATAAGIRSVLALCLAGNGTRGALNLYASYPRAFGVIDRARGLILAALADLAISSAKAHDDEQRRADNLQAALVTRELIGQAQGILIERERITADQAFDILRRASQHLNVKLREVAQTLVETGERPDTGPATSLR
ncbi:MAG: GAF and ANTAR domain-containing protein [Acidimicrobiales bacterium]